MKTERQPTFSTLLLIDHVSEALGVSARTVRRMIAKGELVACRFGRSVRVHPDDLARYIDRQRGLCDYAEPSILTQIIIKTMFGITPHNISIRMVYLRIPVM